MAAGLGFKDFTTGEVLTAADVDGYLMQGVLVFASSAARDAAITSPQEGQFAFLKDTNTTMYYTGSAWTNLDTTGLTNPMTTTGDMIYSSPGSTPVRLGIGSTSQVLTVAGGIPSWATPVSGGMTSLASGSLSSTATNITGISSSYNELVLYIHNIYVSAGDKIAIRLNADSAGNYYQNVINSTAVDVAAEAGDTKFTPLRAVNLSTTSGQTTVAMRFPNYTNTDGYKTCSSSGWIKTTPISYFMNGAYASATAISQINITTHNGTATLSGSYTLYGVK